MRVLIVSVLFMLVGISLELFFGLSGTIYLAMLLILTMFQGGFGVYSILFVGWVCIDLLFLRPLGMTGLTFVVVGVIWEGVKRLSRWRFAAYLLLGIISSFFLGYDSSTYLTIICILLIGWVIVRFLRVAQSAEKEKGML
jgi:hypothetical protein